MSVHFVACRGLKKQESVVPPWGPAYVENTIPIRFNPDCPHNTEGLEVGATYTYQYDEWFRVADNRHQEWKRLNQLADLVGYHHESPDAEGPGPFREFMLYGRHKGVIGPVASAKLVADFVEWDARAWALGDDEFYEWYALIRKMFEYPGETGAVWLRSC